METDRQYSMMEFKGFRYRDIVVGDIEDWIVVIDIYHSNNECRVVTRQCCVKCRYCSDLC